MPQLEFATLPTQLFWLFVTFSVLYFLMVRIALPGISGTLQSRQDKIASDLDQAEKMKIEAESLKQEYEKLLAQTRGNSSNVIAQAHAKAKEQAEKEHEKLDESLAKKIDEAEGEIEKVRQKVEDELFAVSSEMSRLIVKKLTGIKVDEEEAKTSVKTLFKGNG